MSVLVVGLSHSSAPLATLERAIVTGDALGKLTHDVFQAENVAGTFVISTCNRAEIYADVDKFHGGVAAICELLARHSGVPLAELTPHLYVHYEDRAVQHLLAVTCGLDSMVVGESQILGQVRQALQAAREQGTLGRTLAELGAHALHAGKRAHAETGIDRAGVSLVSVGLTMAARRLAARRPAAGRPRTGPAAAEHGSAAAAAADHGPAAVNHDPAAAAADYRPAADRLPAAGAGSLAALSVLVVGAGSMSSLAAGTAARMGAASIVVANRSPLHAERIAATVSAATAATSADLLRLPAEIAAADLVVSCTGAPGLVITAESVRDALEARAPGRPLVLLDLALPRDVEAGAGLLPGVTVIGLEDLREATPEGRPAAAARDEYVAEVQQIVAEEFAAHASAGRAAAVAPTVVALRAKATEVVEAELARLARRLDGMDARSHREIAQSMHRVADKLLHAPTVRVKELAGSPGADSYETALRVLFDLDPDAVLAVVRAHAELVPWPGEEAEQ
jgi:glutamyl-tRNA reductase